MMKDIFSFLKNIAQNNNRDWFYAHRADYEKAMGAFKGIVESMIERVAHFEPEVAGMAVKDCIYRFHRDTRFSLDKSPYKRHFGCYVNPRGKKSLHGGYYLHLEPGNCLLAVGAYGLPSNVLKAVRWSIVYDLERFHTIVTESRLTALYPHLGENPLKTLPAGFPRDFSHPEYLRPREYDMWVSLADDFFLQSDWQDRVEEIFKLMKPYLDFINETVDDYI